MKAKLLKRFMRTTSVFVLIGFLITVAVSYLMLTSHTEGITRNELAKKSEDIIEQMAKHEEEVKELRASLDKDYLERTRAFAEMIKLNPGILEDLSQLQRICKLMDIDELHVCDENGVLKWGSIPKYFGLDFATSEQTRPFLTGLEDKSFEMAQEPQISGKGIYFQYITVSRYDKKGLVQIGMHPNRLDKAMKEASFSNLLKQINMSKDERMIIVNASDGTVLGDSGGPVKSDIPPVLTFDSSKNEDGFTVIEGIHYYYLHTRKEGYHIYNLITKQKMFAQRNFQMIITVISNLFIYVILFLAITFIVRREIIKNIDQITNTLGLLSQGELENVISIHSCKEFSRLSDGINALVQFVKQLLDQMKKSADVVADSSLTIADESKKLETSTNEQMELVEKVAEFLDAIVDEVQNNFESVSVVNVLSQKALENADQCSHSMEELVKAVQAINESTKDVFKIIETINNIALQTNILSLNASAEAARAGEDGKGFSVVAKEVRKLAVQCAQSAKQTEGLINAAAAKTSAAKQLTDETAKAIHGVTGEIKLSSEKIKAIEESSRVQTEAVCHVNELIKKIAEGIEKTAKTAENNSEQSSTLKENAGTMLSSITNISEGL